MFRSDYCCIAIPLYNVGIYAILVQFAVIGLVAGILAVAAPTVLAIAVPSFMTVIFGVLCIAIAALQLAGFWGVYKEKAAAFRKYVGVNLTLVTITALYALVLIIVSATRHKNAVNACLVEFNHNVSNSSQATEVVQGDSLCNIWTWAQLGVCGFLFILLAASETYFCLMERIWGNDQRKEHRQYRSLVSAARESIALRPSGDWDSTSRQASIDNDALRPSARNARFNSSSSDNSLYGGVPELRNAAPAHSGLRNEIGGSRLNVAQRGPSASSRSSPYKTDAAPLPQTTAWAGAGAEGGYAAYRPRPSRSASRETGY